jgi:hypothetical protein
MAGTPLRLCGGCNRNFLTWAANRPGTDMYLCPACTAKLPQWDPQPWAPREIGRRLVSDECSLTTDKRRHRVIARDGDAVTVARYLYPGLGTPFTVRLSATVPVVFGQ